MGFVKGIFKIVLKTFVVLLLVGVGLLIATNASIVYDYAEPHAFTGPDIYNPYRNLDTTNGWKRANFHTHTRVRGVFNECEFWPDSVCRIYESFGYDIIGISNHNEITPLPADYESRMSIYEHGYNPLKFHISVYGSQQVWHFDNMLPIFPFQHQFIIDRLGSDADIVQLNHPVRTPIISRDGLEKIGGYQLIELASNMANIENEYWDWALTAGHYSHGIQNDDMHRPYDAGNIAVRCSFLSMHDKSYASIRQSLLDGCFYSMRIPDYGECDWQDKIDANASLPCVEDIGLRGDTIYIKLSDSADSIKFVGAEHRALRVVEASDTAAYALPACEPYTRIMAFYPDGTVIYSNVFARYDSSQSDSPFRDDTYTPNWTLTLLYNLIIVLCVVSIIIVTYKVVRR